MSELKSLPSSLRDKERYIIFSIEAEDEFDLGDVVDAVWKGLLDYLGEQDVGKMNPWIMGDLFSRKQQVGGIRVTKDYASECRTALALIDRIDGTDVCLHVLGVSGTLNSARDKYLGAIQE